MADHSVPKEFLSNVQSMSEFAQTVARIRDAAEGNYAVTLSPVESRSLIWAMRLLKDGSDGEG